MNKSDTKFQNIDLDVFKVLEALDRKDYDYFDKLTTEQQNAFIGQSFTLLTWMSCIKNSGELGKYYVLVTEELANKHFFNEHIRSHPKLQWLLLCTISPNMGKQYHEYIPRLGNKISNLTEPPDKGMWKRYLTKIYKNVNAKDIDECAIELSENYGIKYKLAKLFPNMKISDIDVLSKMVTEKEILNYERQCGKL